MSPAGVQRVDSRIHQGGTASAENVAHAHSSRARTKTVYSVLISCIRVYSTVTDFARLRG